MACAAGDLEFVHRPWTLSVRQRLQLLKLSIQIRAQSASVAACPSASAVCDVEYRDLLTLLCIPCTRGETSIDRPGLKIQRLDAWEGYARVGEGKLDAKTRGK